MTTSRILARTGRFVALCLATGVVLAVAPKPWARADEGGLAAGPAPILSPDDRRSMSLPWMEVGKRPDLSGVTMNDGVYRGPDLSNYRDCNLSNGRSSRPSC